MTQQPREDESILVARQKKHFNTVADKYQKARQHRNHAMCKALMWQEFFRHFPMQPPDRKLNVLEAMCGFADAHTILDANLQNTFSYTGFDCSDTVVDTLHRERPDLNIYQQDITEFETKETYDLIILLSGLHHVPHSAAKSVQRLTKALAPGGYFISLEPTHNNLLFRYVREVIYRRNSLFDEQTERAFTVPELVGLFEQAGLQQEYVCYPGLLAHVLYYNPDAFPWLNIGTPSLVKAIWFFDRMLLHNAAGRFLSFATLSLWRKP